MDIKRLKNKTMVGNLLYAQVRFGLYKVFDKDNKCIGFASGVGEKIFGYDFYILQPNDLYWSLGKTTLKDFAEIMKENL